MHSTVARACMLISVHLSDHICSSFVGFVCGLAEIRMLVMVMVCASSMRLLCEGANWTDGCKRDSAYQLKCSV